MHIIFIILIMNTEKQFETIIKDIRIVFVIYVLLSGLSLWCQCAIVSKGHTCHKIHWLVQAHDWRKILNKPSYLNSTQSGDKSCQKINGLNTVCQMDHSFYHHSAFQRWPSSVHYRTTNKRLTWYLLLLHRHNWSLVFMHPIHADDYF